MTLADLAAVETAQGAAAVPLALRGPTRRTTQFIEPASCPISASMRIHLADALSVPDGGFSIRVDTCADVRTGYAVSVFPQFERRLLGPVTEGQIARYVSAHGGVLMRPDVVLGGWRNPDDGAAYLDVSIVLSDRECALTLARTNFQAAIWDFAASESVPIGLT